MKTARRIALCAVALATTVTATSCAESKRDENGGGDGGTFVYATSSDPTSLDPAFTTDIATGLVAGQVFEGLTGVKPGSVEVEPRLATAWEASEDGLTYTFDLREGVTFQDGTPFDAKAV